MKVLVTGAAGRLGAEVVRWLDTLHVDCLGVDKVDFDIRDGAAVHNAVQHFRPDAIIHCAAYTAVEQAETEPEKCAEVNGIGTLNVVRAALAVNAKLLYVSDCAVFSGEGDDPWQPADRPNARSVYGLTKAQGEEVIRSLMTRYFIVRTSWLYGGEADDCVQMICRLRNEKEIIASATGIASPTYVRDLAELLCKMLMTERYGVYHAVNEGCCSQAELVREVVRLTGGKASVKADPRSAHASKRPANGRLSTLGLEAAGFDCLPDWQDALNRYLHRSL